MENDLLELIVKERQKQQIAEVLKQNEKTARYQLSLSQKEAELLAAERDRTLRAQRRVEYGEGILPKLISVFCDSPYMVQDTWAETLSILQDIFFEFKNESMDLLTDDELLCFMKEQFDGVCRGSTEYLAGTCLERFARAVRAGYDGYRESGGEGEYEKLMEEKGWDRELFLEVWNELIG